MPDDTGRAQHDLQSHWQHYGFAMAKKRPAIIEELRNRPHRALFIDHLELLDEDIEWLAAIERLTLWNVKVPTGFLSRLEKLWWLDIRGGSASDLTVANGASNLQYLAVNQVRGLCDLSVVSRMTTLRYLDLYGLPKVTQLPSCSNLVKLEHASLGQLRGLLSLQGLLQAPKLRELVFVRKINVNETDVNGIIQHLAIEAFDWFAEDVPSKQWIPVVEKIGLPKPRGGFPEEWFGLPKFTTCNE